MPLDSLAHQLSQADRSIVSTGKHESIEQILNIEKVSSGELCRGPRGFRNLIRNSIVAIFHIYFIFLTDEYGQIASHNLT
jgi:hypothetical protein